MKDYSVDGAFGKVRISLYVPNSYDLQTIACISVAGWHKCNSLYRINRAEIPEFLILMTVKGEGRLKNDGKEYSLTENSVAIIPPNIAVEYFTPEDGLWEFYWITPCGDVSENLCFRLSDAYFPEKCALLNIPKAYFSGLLEELLKVELNSTQRRKLRASDIFLNLLHTFLNETLSAPENELSETCAPAVNYIEKNFDKPIKVEDLSSLLYLSPAHFIRVFKREMGYTPHEYILKIRVLKAQQQLKQTNKTIKEIAFTSGFNQVSNFIAKYKKITGETPGNQRR